MTLTCEACLGDFEHVKRGQRPKACPECRTPSGHRRRPKVCRVCSTAYTACSTRTTGGCSTECIAILAIGLGAYPSRADFERATAEPTEPPPLIFVSGYCHQCTAPYTFRTSAPTGGRWCGVTCASARAGVRRDTRIHDVLDDPTLTWHTLYREDGPACHLCNEATDPLDYIDVVTRDGLVRRQAGNLYPSLDHVIALANGGRHARGNARLAHRICNSRKRHLTVSA